MEAKTKYNINDIIIYKDGETKQIDTVTAVTITETRYGRNVSYVVENAPNDEDGYGSIPEPNIIGKVITITLDNGDVINYV